MAESRSRILHFGLRLSHRFTKIRIVLAEWTMECGVYYPLTVIVAIFLFVPTSWSNAGTKVEERDICLHSLNALLHGNTEAEAEYDSSELTSDLPSAEQKADVIRQLNSMVDLMQGVGEGLPTEIGSFEDVSLYDVRAAGVIARINFPNGHLAFVGCVRFIANDGFWTTAVRFDEDKERLINALQHPEKSL